MKRAFLLLMLVSLPVVAAETGYRIVHPDGTVEFTDDPTRGGEAIELRETPTYEAVPQKAKPTTPVTKSSDESAADSQQEETPDYQSMSIVSPGPGQTIWFDGKPLSVQVKVVPRLAKGHSVVVTLDGSEVARGQQTGFSLSRVYRGTHTLGASVVAADGSTLLTASPVTFHMRQHTLN